MIYDFIIIGGGAAGLMLASSLDLKNKKGLILEKTKTPGAKILISGGGHCNITHDGSIKDFVSCYGKNGKKIRSILYKHSNLKLIDWLLSNGIQTITKDDQRVFPKSMDSKEILDFLLSTSEKNGWELIKGAEVTEVTEFNQAKDNSNLSSSSDDYEDAANKKVIYNIFLSSGKAYKTNNLILATGGQLHSKLKIKGLEETKLKPALVPLRVSGYPYSDLSGISVKDAEVSVITEGKEEKLKGDILFTHKDFSGPAILNISRYAEPSSTLKINYLPGSADPLLDMKALPKRLQKTLNERATVNGNLKTKLLKNLLTSDTFSIQGFGSGAMVTSGGIMLSQINLKGMNSISSPNLYIIGEALDIDGFTGGYNLQFAYSSAMTAAESLKKKYNL